MSRHSSEVEVRVRQAKKDLLRAGATWEQIFALELAILKQVQSHAGIGGNASTYVNARVTSLEGEWPS
jgi:hypothetical protein